MERDKGSVRWLPPRGSSPHQGRMGVPPNSFITAIADTTQHISGLSTPPCFLISDVSCLTPASLLVAHMNIEDKYGLTSEVQPNSTRGELVKHEIVFTEVVWTLDRMEAIHPWEMS